MRRSQFDCGSQPVRNLVVNPSFEGSTGPFALRTNLATNPSFETASGTVNVRTNLATNPSFESATGTVHVRTNLAPNPNFETNIFGATANAGTGGVAVSSRQTSGGLYGSSSYRAQWTTGTSAISGYLEVASLSAAGTGIVAGSAYTFSAYIRSSFATSIFLRANWWNGTSSTGGAQGSTISVPANTWTRISLVNTTAPAGTTGVWIDWFFNTLIPTNGTVDLDGVLLEQIGAVMPFFDGSTSAAGDFTYAWTGTANASASLQQAPQIATWLNRWFGANGGAGSLYQAKGGLSGNYARKHWLVANNGSSQDTGINTPDTPISANTSYTLSAWVRSSVAQVFNPYIAWKTSGGATISSTPQGAGQAVVPNVWKRISVSGISPATAALGTFVVTPYINAISMPADSTIDFDNVLIEAMPTLLDYFDGASPLQNLITNPNFETNITGYNAANQASLSRIASTSMSGSYVGRVTFTGETTHDSGVNFTGAFTATPSRTYTLSLDVISSISRTVKFSAQGTGVVNQEKLGIALSAGIKSRIWFTFQSTSTAPSDMAVYLLRTDTQLGTIDIDRVMVEMSPNVNPYYEGQGDFTYAWTGTANASNSVQKAPFVVGTGYVPYLSLAYQSKTGSTSGSKSIRITPTNVDSGDSFVEIAGLFSGYTFKPNTTYTLAADRTIEAPQTNGGGTSHFRVNIGTELTPTIVNGPTNVAGTVRVVGRFTTGASTTLNFVRLYNGSSAGGGDVWWDNVTLDEGITSGTYFDGSTPATGDFTYNWVGTANNSTSQQKAIGISGGYGNNTPMYQSSEWSSSGSKSLRMTPVSSSADTFVTIPYTLETGKTYTIMGTLRLSAPQTGTPDGRARSILVYHSGGSSASPTAPNVAGVYPLRVTFKVTDGAAFQVIRLYNGASAGNGDVWWDNIMLVEGTYNGNYIDGSKPLSKWLGTPNDSMSVGYPS